LGWQKYYWAHRLWPCFGLLDFLVHLKAGLDFFHLPFFMFQCVWSSWSYSLNRGLSDLEVSVFFSLQFLAITLLLLAFTMGITTFFWLHANFNERVIILGLHNKCCGLKTFAGLTECCLFNFPFIVNEHYFKITFGLFTSTKYSN
jgi:hypothetical protein